MNKEVPAGTAGSPSALRDEIETLVREVYGDRLETFLETPRRSLGLETPTALIEAGRTRTRDVSSGHGLARRLRLVAPLHGNHLADPAEREPQAT